MQRVQLYFEEEDVVETQREAKSQGISWAEYIRLILRQHRNQQKNLKKDLSIMAGKYQGKDKKGAINHNDIYN